MSVSRLESTGSTGSTGSINIEIKSLPVPTIVNPVRNVHVYDGTIQHRFNVPEYPLVQKELVFARLRPILTPESQLMLDIISSKRAYDHANKYKADDLLFYILAHGKGEDLLQNLNEQLTDAYRLGQCPQGQVIRLLSLVQPFCV